MALSAVVPDRAGHRHAHITTMEIVDNAHHGRRPGRDGGRRRRRPLLGQRCPCALVIAGAVAFPVNRWLITRGKGHAVRARDGNPRRPADRAWSAVVAAVAAVFGATVLIAEAASDGGGAGTVGIAPPRTWRGGDGSRRGAGSRPRAGGGDGGLKLALDSASCRAAGEQAQLPSSAPDGQPVRDYEVEHEKRMHLIVVRRDLTGFQHLHPRLGRGRHAGRTP